MREMASYTEEYIEAVQRVLTDLDVRSVNEVIGRIHLLKQRGGRLFVIGVGGSAANASHAVNDLRKIAGIEAYAPTDNVAELTARTNDDGWATVFVGWLKVSRLGSLDAVLVLSVGGGSGKVSWNIVEAVRYARESGATVLGIFGRDGGYTARHADAVVIVPMVEERFVTAVTESMQSVLLHLIVTGVGI